MDKLLNTFPRIRASAVILVSGGEAMGKLGEVIADALHATFLFIGQSVKFIVGLLGVVLVTALSLSGEVLDDLGNWEPPIPWKHIAKVVIPPCAVSMVAYIQHRRLVEQALNATATAENGERGWSTSRRTEAPRSEFLSRARRRPV
jgi:hypothetical protein